MSSEFGKHNELDREKEVSRIKLSRDWSFFDEKRRNKIDIKGPCFSDMLLIGSQFEEERILLLCIKVSVDDY